MTDPVSQTLTLRVHEDRQKHLIFIRFLPFRNIKI